MTDQPADYATATIRGVLSDLQRIVGEPARSAQASEIERLSYVLDSLSAELAEAASALRGINQARLGATIDGQGGPVTPMGLT
jgi:hypothetical protein